MVSLWMHHELEHGLDYRDKGRVAQPKCSCCLYTPCSNGRTLMVTQGNSDKLTTWRLSRKAPKVQATGPCNMHADNIRLAKLLEINIAAAV